MTSVLEGIVAIIIMAVIMNGVVQIIKVSKAPGGRKQNSRLSDIDATVANLEEEVDDLRARVEVLEKIVTDEKTRLDREINNLAG